ncbi:patatin-like phospholipase family protein [Dyella caseinilytica]|uniref:patatin-like phospholipase family protein n=1 Tax=Dyella caseinilytica TaxID=1849581 RepID=UPI00193FA1D7|nr:patatin-like phospholipase family protein [Dyella caseinilytica]GFZ89783.1 hypothetical protein GCM10011408_06050 [Dyella caseinilytica]
MNSNSHVNAQAVKQVELEIILGGNGRTKDGDPAIWGLALSGGGIRSATFSLGVLQALAKLDLLRGFHYLSTVSGGGYVGGFLQGLIRRWGGDKAFDVLKSSVRDFAKSEDPAAETNDPDGAIKQDAIDNNSTSKSKKESVFRSEKKVASADTLKPILHLREYSNYLSPRKTALSGDTLGMIGTYVRNVVLIQIQLCTLLFAFSLMPLFLYPWIEKATHYPSWCLMLAAATGLSAAALLGVVTTRTPRATLVRKSRGRLNLFRGKKRSMHARTEGVLDKTELPRSGVKGKAAAIIWLLAFSAGLAAIGFRGLKDGGWNNARFLGNGELFLCTFVLYVVAWIAWIVYDECVRGPRKGEDAEDRWPRIARLLFTAMIAGAFVGMAVLVLRHVITGWRDGWGLWKTIIFGPSLVLISIELTGIIHLGLAGRQLSELQREVWARVGGKAAALVGLGLGLSLFLMIYGAWLYRCYIPGTNHWLTRTAWGSAIAWILTTGSGVMAAYTQRGGDPGKLRRILDVLARIAPWVFLLGLIIAISTMAQHVVISKPDLRAMSTVHGVAHHIRADAYLAKLDHNLRDELMNVAVGVALVAGIGVWILMGYLMDLNEFSMNAFYRNRLVRCYLGASNKKRNPEPTTNFDPNDDIMLNDVVTVKGGNSERPLFPLIGTTLNLVDAKQLDWQSRKAASFCFTPNYCGYIPPPSHPNSEPVGDIELVAPDTASIMTLGEAMAISGAAVSPNMGYHSSPAATFLLTLFDARLGWWLPHPGLRRKGDFAKTFYGSWLIKEMLGLTRETGKFLYLSDGGHFENLGIYELVRRQCRFILSVDASADSDREFEDLGNAIQKCRIDFGVEITIDVSGLRCNDHRQSLAGYAVGTIDYANGQFGTLLYIKPTLTGKEPADIAYYAKSHSTFPHEPTYNQFFDEAQFESYRRLGSYIANEALQSVKQRAEADISDGTSKVPEKIGVTDSVLKERILVELENNWEHHHKKAAGKSVTHLEAMSRLFGELRRNPALSRLDRQFYPAWNDRLANRLFGSPARSANGAQVSQLELHDEDFRKSFYFCQELAHLMESVYHDLDLENFSEHIDNRGWMNTFRQWSWSPIFRMAWVIGSPTYGRRYVTFCEQKLNLPRLVEVVEVREEGRVDGETWIKYCRRLHRENFINELEQSILVDSPVVSGQDKNLKLFMLRMKWEKILIRSHGKQLYTTLGVAVLSARSIVIFRVQDHLRRLGLAPKFMELLLESAKHIADVKITSGRYGLLGEYDEQAADCGRRRVSELLNIAKAYKGSIHEGDEKGAFEHEEAEYPPG